MALRHIGTWDTLQAIDTSSGIVDGDTAHIYYNARSRVFIYVAAGTESDEATDHPYYIEPTSGPGHWVESIGNDYDVYSGDMIRTGAIESLNYIDGTSGMKIDLDNELIAIRDDTFGNAGVQLGWISSAYKFYVGDGANQFLQFDGTKLTWKGANSQLDGSGNLVVTGGTIGGFTLAATTLTATNLLLDAGNQRIQLGSGNDIVTLDAADADYRLAIGHATYASAPFRVTKAGVLTATGASISGAITGSTIDIGGADATSFHVDANGNMWLGAATYNIATNPFAVSSAGLLRAVSGGIGGWTLGATSLTSTNIGLHSGASAEILLGHATTYANAKIGLKNDGSGKLANGNISWTAAGLLTQSVGDGGSITLDVGADLILSSQTGTGDDDRGVVKFNLDGMNIVIAGDYDYNAINFQPSTAETGMFQVGALFGASGTKAFKYIMMYSSTQILSQVGYSGTLYKTYLDLKKGSDYCSVDLVASYGAGIYAAIRLSADDSDGYAYTRIYGVVGIGVKPNENADLTLEGGALCIKERTTPTADTNYGKIYTKTDNKLYFQDGAGSEHEISLAT